MVMEVGGGGRVVVEEVVVGCGRVLPRRRRR